MNDPQRCRGGPEAVAAVKLWMTPCACGHVMLEHDIADPRTKRAGLRVACLTTERSGKCPCMLYIPPSEGSDEETAGPVASGPASSRASAREA